MIENCKIKHIGETRKFEKKNGEKSASTEVVFSWEVERPGYQNFEQSIVANVFGWFNNQLAEDYRKDGRELKISFSFGHRAWKDKEGKLRYFNDITAGVPKELILEAEPF